MDETEAIEMDEDERDAFLGNGDTGVISFASTGSDAPHSIPVSYGYDATDVTFYFRLAVGEDSDKSDPGERAVTFVTYGQVDDGWRSVVVKGHLEASTEDSIATETLQGFENVHIPIVDIFGRPLQDVSFEFYRLVSNEVTSRREERASV